MQSLVRVFFNEGRQVRNWTDVFFLRAHLIQSTLKIYNAQNINKYLCSV